MAFFYFGAEQLKKNLCDGGGGIDDDSDGDDGDDVGNGDGNMTKVLWNFMSSSVRTKQMIFHYWSRQKRCGQSWLADFFR